MKLVLIGIISKSTLTLTFAVLILIGMIASFTSATFTGLYQTSTSLLGTGEDLAVIHYGRARAPLTGITPLSIYRFLKIDGIEAVSPEAVAPIIISNEPFFARGIDPEGFYKLQELHTIAGRRLTCNETASAFIGETAAKRLGVHLGNRILALGGLAEQAVELEVVGIFRSQTPLDSELLVPLWVGQWLRGMPPQYVSLIRVKIDRDKLTAQTLQNILTEGKAMDQSKTVQVERSIVKTLAFAAPTVDLSLYILENPEDSLKAFLEREAGLTETTLWTLFSLTFSCSILTIYYAISTLVHSSSRQIAVIRAVGASKKEMESQLIALSLLMSLASSSIGLILGLGLAQLFSYYGLLMLTSYTINPSLSLEGVLVILIVPALATLLSIKFSLSKLFEQSIYEAIIYE